MLQTLIRNSRKGTSVEKILEDLSVAKASRIDSISSKVIKGCSVALAFHLANIISLLIKLDTFPSKWKIAKTKPLFKKRIKIKAKKL